MRRHLLSIVLVGTWLATCMAWLLASGLESDAFGVAGLLWGLPWSAAMVVPAGEIGRRVWGDVPMPAWLIFVSAVGIISMLINAWLLARLGAWLQRIILRDMNERAGSA